MYYNYIHVYTQLSVSWTNVVLHMLALNLSVSVVSIIQNLIFLVHQVIVYHVKVIFLIYVYQFNNIFLILILIDELYTEVPEHILLPEGPFEITCKNIVNSNIHHDNFTWCVYILSHKYDIHGCINATGIIFQTQAAESIGLLDIFHIPTQQNTDIGLLQYTRIDQLLNNALITCSVNNEFISAISLQALVIDSKYVCIVLYVYVCIVL